MVNVVDLGELVDHDVVEEDEDGEEEEEDDEGLLPRAAHAKAAGNAHFRHGRFSAAIQAYSEALRAQRAHTAATAVQIGRAHV